MKSIPRIPFKKYNSPTYRALERGAMNSNTVFIVIIDRRMYSQIEYDVATIWPRVTLSGKSTDKIVEMYESYAKTSHLSKRYFEYAGGNGNLIIRVKKNDAEKFAQIPSEFVNANLEQVKQ